jgi:hypothetical protein
MVLEIQGVIAPGERNHVAEDLIYQAHLGLSGRRSMKQVQYEVPGAVGVRDEIIAAAARRRRGIGGALAADNHQLRAPV